MTRLRCMQAWSRLFASPDQLQSKWDTNRDLCEALERREFVAVNYLLHAGLSPPASTTCDAG